MRISHGNNRQVKANTRRITAADEDEMEFTEDEEAMDIDGFDDDPDVDVEDDDFDSEDFDDSDDSEFEEEEVEEDDVDIEVENNIANHYIAECDRCHGVFISALVETDQEVDSISGTCPLCGKDTEQYLKWIIKEV